MFTSLGQFSGAIYNSVLFLTMPRLSESDRPKILFVLKILTGKRQNKVEELAKMFGVHVSTIWRVFKSQKETTNFQGGRPKTARTPGNIKNIRKWS